MGNFGRCDRLQCPYGKPGARLWVRETFYADHYFAGDYEQSGFDGTDESRRRAEAEWIEAGIFYRANGEAHEQLEDHIDLRWRPSIHMPRWASRITLEITGVRVERLNEISEADAMAEGARCLDLASGREAILGDGSYRDHYRHIWETIHGAGSWAKNPWVWVLEFKRVAK